MARRPKFTKEELVAALRAAGGDPERARQELGVDLSTVYRAMRRYGVQVQEERRVVAA